MSTRLAQLPGVDRVLSSAPLVDHPASAGIKTRVVRDAIATLRARLQADATLVPPDAARVARQVADMLTRWLTPHPAPVINATGILLHTNLGRAPLSSDARAAMVAASGYSELEIELTSGRRGSRHAWMRPLLRALLGAEDAHVVNNGAAALLLACSALAAPDGVVISRGQMVEIGDRFRVAEMAAAGGARLWEIGSTNRTHLHDYERALAGDGATRPAAILWVHQSNFHQHGFVASVALRELTALAHAYSVPLIADLGSGSLGPLRANSSGPPVGADEPTIQACLEAGVDLVTCSGDKLLGGPQAGLLAGRAALVERCRRHPLARALRLDKTSIAALHTTVAAHARADAARRLPLQQMASVSIERLTAHAHALVDAMGWERSCVRASQAAVGGGALPGETFASVAVVVPRAAGLTAATLARHLRLGAPPVVARVRDDEVWIDLRTVSPDELGGLQRALTAALARA